ncbi:MAG: hypothetical protein HC825_01390 [Oscillatoriales cyanobacterium RM1_1_9]|nr:hypothetical protein [Oscillatoriales cyanobacterium SM2_3_0]NJO46779.1 hypothetical protein [Oscillatoriales cyanobacterium RM2_1_1]NJO70721.1 hypothetical protein [Oscillatoriales cyanobacterium RM1_1_9]
MLLLGVPLGAGLIWVANLPYPMVRKPVSKVAPLLLLPSYLKMDRGYREAIRYTEQSDQLINQATSPADIGLGAEKVELAQNALDDLPVWFLGYQPEYYCRWFDCQWRFTVDEFEQARKTIGRLEAQVFQESNAQTQLNQIEQELTRAKQQFQIAPDLAAKQQAIASWQTAIDQLAAVPRETLAGTLAEQQLKTNERDFTNLTGGISQRAGGNNLIAAAMQFAMQAAQTSQNPPHSALQWQQIKTLWQEAIDRLKQVQADNPAYLEAQKKLAEYQANLGTVQTRLQMEQEAADALQSAKGDIADLQRFTETESSNLGEYNRKLRQIMNQLETIQPGTTAYGEAQQLLQFARKRL